MIDAAAFFDAYAKAWNARDIEALASFYAVPLLIATDEATQFIEAREALVAHLAALLGDYDEHGLATAALTSLETEELPDGAARATARWRFLGADGAEKLAYPLVATLAPDDSEPDAVPRIVALDVRGEIAAQVAAGWGM